MQFQAFFSLLYDYVLIDRTIVTCWVNVWWGKKQFIIEMRSGDYAIIARSDSRQERVESAMWHEFLRAGCQRQYIGEYGRQECLISIVLFVLLLLSFNLLIRLHEKTRES